MQPHIARQGAEERNSVSNEHGHTSDDETLNQACAQESLNRDPPVDVEVVGATGGEFGNNLSRRPGHLFHNASAHCGEVEGPAAQDYYALVTVWPFRKGQNRLEGLAAYHQRIDASDELVVTVGFAAALRQKIEIAIWPRHEAVDADPDKDRYRHSGLLTGGRLTIQAPFPNSL